MKHELEVTYNTTGRTIIHFKRMFLNKIFTYDLRRSKLNLSSFPNISGVVSVSHSEGGTQYTPLNNLTFVLRALSGWIVHSNIGAVLVVDDDVVPTTAPLEGI